MRGTTHADGHKRALQPQPTNGSSPGGWPPGREGPSRGLVGLNGKPAFPSQSRCGALDPSIPSNFQGTYFQRHLSQTLPPSSALRRGRLGLLYHHNQRPRCGNPGGPQVFSPSLLPPLRPILFYHTQQTPPPPKYPLCKINNGSVQRGPIGLVSLACPDRD